MAERTVIRRSATKSYAVLVLALVACDDGPVSDTEAARTNPDLDCTSLPTFAQDSMPGSIDAEDDENPDGSHYELFRVPQATSAIVEIVMESSEVDSYLVLYDSTGTFIDENDDATDATSDARVEQPLEPGCYILMATTQHANEFGDYGLLMSER